MGATRSRSYEPFAGSGSQIIAGEANDRRVNAMEISGSYVDVAIERWQAHPGREAVLDGDGLTFAEVREERLGSEGGDETDPEDEAALRREEKAA